MPSTDEYLGFLKYEGSRVEGGFIDARGASRALSGFDFALRYLISSESPEFGAVDFPIPVRIQRGSWEAIVPHDVVGWMTTAGGVALTKYLATAAKKAAEKDFEKLGVKDLFVHAFASMRWLIEIGKHLGSFSYREITSPKWGKNNTDIGIPNEKDEYLYVPIKYFKIYANCPIRLFSDMSSLVDTQCELTIGAIESDGLKTAKITIREKHIFCLDKPIDDGILFPELIHAMSISLDGVVTRGNEVTNSIGFRYHEHILQCFPRTGSIVRFKQHLFVPCRIFGTISRESPIGNIDELKPKIIFDDLQILEGYDSQTELPY